MKFLKKSFLVALLFSAHVLSMMAEGEAKEKPAELADDGICRRIAWSSRDADPKRGLEAQVAKKIIIGHTVSDSPDTKALLVSIQNNSMDNKKWAWVSMSLLEARILLPCANLTRRDFPIVLASIL